MEAMPHVTGLQLTDAIKREWPELPVIIPTGFDEMASEAQSVLPKLAKPFTEAELVREHERIVPRGRDGGRVLKEPPEILTRSRV
jgi:CheY-like chemotaxis protein